METLDKCFENVCELDLIFHVTKVEFASECFKFIFNVLQVHYILEEIVMGGLVLETGLPEILEHVEAQNAVVKSENPLSTGIRDLVGNLKR